MLVSAGRHSYRVIAQNRFGSHSSRDRAFVAAGGAKVHRYSHTYYSGGQEYFRSDDGILDADVTFRRGTTSTLRFSLNIGRLGAPHESSFIEIANLYVDGKRRKGYRDRHTGENTSRVVHSSVPHLGYGKDYQLAINVTLTGTEHGRHFKYEQYIRLDFKLLEIIQN